MLPIHLIITKGTGQGDTATFRSGEKEAIQITPKQGVLPLPFVFYVVEKLFGLNGMLRSLHDEGLSDAHESEDSERQALQAEALAEVFQSELWGKPVLDDEFAAMVQLTCHNYEVPPVFVTPIQIAEGRELLKDLTEKWNAVAPGGFLEVVLKS